MLRATSYQNLLTVSAMVVVAALSSAPRLACAQSFNATGTVVAGSAAITIGPGMTKVDVNSPSAVIDWAPASPAGGGPINFQPTGTTAIFSNLDTADYAVLNRIIPRNPARPVVFNGTVISQMRDLATGLVSRGGTLFFYSPAGILIGPTGVFDVGSLALTASDLDFDDTGAFDSAGSYKFLPANSGSVVEIKKGASITAGPVNAYVALVAPKVANSGTITVDGSAVLVAADASTITFRPNGLFDVQIEQGTSAAGEVVTNDGSINGPAGTINTAHRIYVVAVPKNDAITLAIKGGSKLGFDIAGAADVEGNAIVLSAGYGVISGDIEAVRSAASGPVPAALGIGAIDATSQLTGKATGQVSLLVQGGKAASFASNVSISGVTDATAVNDDGAFVSVSGVGSTLDISGDLAVQSLDGGIVSGSGVIDFSPARVTVSDGRIKVRGKATIFASRIGYGGQTGKGGEAALVAKGSAVVEVDKNLELSGDGIGEAPGGSLPSGTYPGVGGNVHLSLSGGAAVTVNGDLDVHAAGSGGPVGLSGPVGINGYVGSDGIGGRAVVEGLTGGGRLLVSGALTVDVSGTGANGKQCGKCVIEGGIGTGGIAGLTAAPGTTMTITGRTEVNASGLGGAAFASDGKNGGSGFGGTAFVGSTGGTITLYGQVSVLADGRGGGGSLVSNVVSGALGPGGHGGTGKGGSASIAAGDAAMIGAGGSVAVTGALVTASGVGGNGGTGATGTGGLAIASARDGSLGGGGIQVSADGFGGAGYNGGNGGAGNGGAAQLMGYSALEGEGKVAFGSAAVTAVGRGNASITPISAGAVGAAGGAGGDGTGGQTLALAEAGNAILTIGGARMDASGIGGAGADGNAVAGGTGGGGGAGFGGTATFGVVSGLDTGGVRTGSATFADTNVVANGRGGFGGAGGLGSTAGAGGSGGNAAGGEAVLVVQGGVANLQASALIQANALGGDGGSGGGGGGAGGHAAVGGNGGLLDTRGVRLVGGSRDGHADQNGQLNAEEVAFTASATGGKGATLGTAEVRSHPLTILLDGAAIKAKSLDFTAAGDAAPGAAPSLITLMGGDTRLNGGFSFVTPGTLTVALGGSDLFSDTTLISAGNWLGGAVPAGTSGTIHGATSVSLLTAGDLFGYLSADTSGILTVSASGLIRLDNMTAGAAISANAGTSLLVGNISAGGSVNVGAGGSVAVGRVGAGGDAVLTAAGALWAGSVSARETTKLNGIGSITLGGDVVAGDSIALVSDGAITGKGLSAGLVRPSLSAEAAYSITVFGKGAVTLDALSATHDIKLFTPQILTVGSLAARDIALLAGRQQTIGSITATNLALLAGYEMIAAGGDPLGDYDLDALFAAVPIADGGSISVLSKSRAGSLMARSVMDIAIKALTATGVIDLQSGGALVTGDLTGGSIEARAGGTLDLAAAKADTLLRLNAGGALTSGNLSGDTITVNGAGHVTIGAVSATFGDANFNANGALRSGAVTALGSILITGGEALTTGDLTAGRSVLVSAAADAAIGVARGGVGTVQLRSNGGSLTVGAVNAAGDTALAAANDLAVGDISARDMLLLAGGNVRAATLASQGGRILIANNSLVSLGGGIDEFDFDPVFAAPLRPASGTLTVSGAVSGGAFTAALGGNAALLGIDAAQSILVDSGGMVSLAGVWEAPQIDIGAKDVVMPEGSGLNAGLTGTINLASRNSSGARIGDGLDDSLVPGSAYMLDNAEWGRIRSGSLRVSGIDGDRAVDMLIGKLDVTGPKAGSTIDDPAGTVIFRTVTAQAAVPSGTIRVTGALTATGFGADNALVFQTGQFQLAADTGAIVVLGEGDALSGGVRIAARDVHVAAASLLTRLAADPFFAGVETAVDTESAGGSASVLRAGALDLTVGRTLYVQRTGTGIDPLGFEGPLNAFKIMPAGNNPVTMIVNGTFRTAAGIVRGGDAFRLFKDSGVDLSNFTSDSRLNGCPLGATTCGVPLTDPGPSIRNLVDVLDYSGLGDTTPDDPDERSPQSGSAIVPPKIFLPKQPFSLSQKIDEPISGSGNPGLIGAGVGAGAAAGGGLLP